MGETRKREIQFGDGRKGFERELGEIAEIHLEQARPCTFDLRYNHEMQLQWSRAGAKSRSYDAGIARRPSSANCDPCLQKRPGWRCSHCSWPLSLCAILFLREGHSRLHLLLCDTGVCVLSTLTKSPSFCSKSMREHATKEPKYYFAVSAYRKAC